MIIIKGNDITFVFNFKGEELNVEGRPDLEARAFNGTISGPKGHLGPDDKPFIEKTVRQMGGSLLCEYFGTAEYDVILTYQEAKP